MMLLFFFFISHLPKIYQSFLMSATLSEDVQALKELLLHNPVMSCSHIQSLRLSSTCKWQIWFTWLVASVFPHTWFHVPVGDPEASGLPASWQQPAAAVQHQVWGGGQVPAHLHAAEAAAGSGQDAGVCWSVGQVLQAQTVPGTVWYSCLRA